MSEAGKKSLMMRLASCLGALGVALLLSGNMILMAPPVTYVGPGDSGAYAPGAVLGYYGVPCYSAAYAAGAGNIWTLNNGTTTTTYTCLSNGGWNEASAATFCATGAAGHCFIATAFNQSGGSWPSLVIGTGDLVWVAFNVQNGHAMIDCQAGSNAQLSAGSVTRPTLPYTVAYTVLPSNVTASVMMAGGSSNGQIEIGESAGKYSSFSGTRLSGSTATTGTFAANAAIFGTTTSGATDSQVQVNNVATTGNAGTSTPPTTWGMCDQVTSAEFVGRIGNALIDNERMTATQLTNGFNNQKAGGGYW